jgi:hypothetical protein
MSASGHDPLILHGLALFAMEEDRYTDAWRISRPH